MEPNADLVKASLRGVSKQEACAGGQAAAWHTSNYSVHVLVIAYSRVMDEVAGRSKDMVWF